jgi:hypothetical protein
MDPMPSGAGNLSLAILQNNLTHEVRKACSPEIRVCEQTRNLSTIFVNPGKIQGA